MASDAQTHVGSLIWFGKEISSDLDIEKIKQNKDKRYTHDNLFHTLLGIFEVQTKAYNKDMDITK